MFKLHLPHRKWEKEQIIFAETISEIIEEIWKWLPEIVEQEHIIIEQTGQPPNQAMHSDGDKPGQFNVKLKTSELPRWKPTSKF